MEKRESGMIPAASTLYRCPEPAPTPDSGLFARYGQRAMDKHFLLRRIAARGIFGAHLTFPRLCAMIWLAFRKHIRAAP